MIKKIFFGIIIFLIFVFISDKFFCILDPKNIKIYGLTVSIPNNYVIKYFLKEYDPIEYLCKTKLNCNKNLKYLIKNLIQILKFLLKIIFKIKYLLSVLMQKKQIMILILVGKKILY